MRPAKVTWDEALRAYVMSDNSITDAPGYAAATAIIEADRAELVAEIVAWLDNQMEEYPAGNYALFAKMIRDEIAAKWEKA